MKPKTWSSKELEGFKKALERHELAVGRYGSKLLVLVGCLSSDTDNSDIAGVECLREEYVPIALLGSGVSGRTYLAYHNILQRFHAVKLIDSARVNPREVRMLASLKHENIVEVYGASSGAWLIEGTPMFSIEMEFVDGLSLEQMIQIEEVCNGRPVELKHAIRISQDILAGVIYLRQQGIFHRDLNPRNIVLHGEIAKIVDFGIATYLGSPAQDNRRYGGTTDLFSWALITYRLVAGEHLIASRAECADTEEYAVRINRLKEQILDDSGKVHPEIMKKMEAKVGGDLAGKIGMAMLPDVELIDLNIYLLTSPDDWKEYVHIYDNRLKKW